MLQAKIDRQKTFKIFIAIALIFGIFFRFVNIDRKNYWNDEVFTSLRISGYTVEEVQQQVFTGRQINVEELRQYQSANADKSLVDTVKGLALEEAQLPPLYFVLVRLWTQWFGSSVAATRSLSALISLLVFPCLYWLCLELFESPLVGGVAIMLVAVSPFQVLYAQEARMYSLWSVQILLSCAAFLRAIRLNTKASWLVYTATIILGMYAHLLSMMVTFGQGIYLFVVERFKLTRKTFYYFFSGAIALLFFLPWLGVIFYYSSGVESALNWMEKRASISESLMNFIKNISKSLIDIGSEPAFFFDLVLLTLVGYSIYFLCRRTAIKVWLLVLTLIFVPPIILTLRDIVSNSESLGHARYVVPSYMGIQLSLAYLLAAQLNNFSIERWIKKFWQLTIVVLISGGILSCTISAQAETWSNKYNSNMYPVARILNRCDRPLLINDNNLIQVLSLSHLLDANVWLQLIETNQLNKLPNDFSNFSDAFIFKPSRKFKKTIDEKLTTEKRTSGLWQIKNRPTRVARSSEIAIPVLSNFTL
jgi:uncharacterized membrane protein